MIPFSEASQMMQGIVIACLYIALCSSVFFVIYRIVRTGDVRTFASTFIVPVILTTLLLHILYWHFLPIQERKTNAILPKGICNLPYLLHIAISLSAFLWCMWQLWNEKKIRNTSINLYSIYQAINDLPVGLCFAQINGIPLLVNRRMYDLTQELTASPFQNAENLWKYLLLLKETKESSALNEYSLPTFRYRDGRIIQFARTTLSYNEKNYIQITVSDISKLLNLSEELKRNNEELKNWHLRLKHLSDNIANIKHEEEVLNSKIHIHSQLGHCILKTQAHLLQRHPSTEEELIRMWKDVATKMETILFDAKEQYDNSLEELYHAAESIGCHIEITGELPVESETAYLILSAVRESVTNAVLHGEADRVFVTISDINGFIDVQIKNNCRKKVTSLSEGGGLGNLRKKIETQGGNMDIQMVNDSFELSLSLPKL